MSKWCRWLKLRDRIPRRKLRCRVQSHNGARSELSHRAHRTKCVAHAGQEYRGSDAHPTDGRSVCTGDTSAVSRRCLLDRFFRVPLLAAQPRRPLQCFVSGVGLRPVPWLGAVSWMTIEQFRCAASRRPHCALRCQKIIEKRLLFDAKKPNGRIHSVIDAYAFFELSLTTLPTHMRKKDYLFNCLEVPFSLYRWRESCQLTAKNPGTILAACKT